MSENTTPTTELDETQLVETDGTDEETAEQPKHWSELDLEELLGDEQEFTAYRIHTKLNEIFEVAGVEKVRPQMIYNYARNGMVVKGESVQKGNYIPRTYTRAEVLEFITKFAPRYVKRHS